MKAMKAMKGKGKRKDGLMMIYVRTLSGQERTMLCHEGDTIANVKAGLPIDYATVAPSDIIVFQKVEGWRQLGDGQIKHGATLYVVNEQCINDEDLFNFTRMELPKRWVNQLTKVTHTETITNNETAEQETTRT